MTRYHLPSSRYSSRRATLAIIIHHTAGLESQTVEEIRRFHTRPQRPPPGWAAKNIGKWRPGRGWIDIGYHWLLRYGEAVPGRPEWAKGAHAAATVAGQVRGWNSRSVGVALVGDYRASPPPYSQRRALRRLLGDLLQRYPGARVLSHRDAMAEVGAPDHTTCPGSDWLAPELERLAIAGLLTT